MSNTILDGAGCPTLWCGGRLQDTEIEDVFTCDNCDCLVTVTNAIPSMKTYIGAKIVKARPMGKREAHEYLGRDTVESNERGYLVKYDDNYESWSPAYIFERCYREIATP